jgi:hypothetical protein
MHPSCVSITLVLFSTLENTWLSMAIVQPMNYDKNIMSGLTNFKLKDEQIIERKS